jgi:hypothetical protein
MTRMLSLVLLFMLGALPQPRLASAIGLNQGDILVADNYYYGGNLSRILRVDPSGTVTVLCTTTGTILKSPIEAISEGGANLWILDLNATADNGGLLRLDLGTGALTPQVSGLGVSGSYGFSLAPSGDFIFAHPGGGIVQVGVFGAPRVVLAGYNNGAKWPQRVILEPAGSLLFLDIEPEVRRFTSGSGVSLVAWNNLLDHTRDLTQAPDGTIYVVAATGVVKIAGDGTVSLLATGGLLVNPISITMALGGMLLVGTDNINAPGSIVRIDPASGQQSYFLFPGTVNSPIGLSTVIIPTVAATPASWGRIKASYR